MGKREIDHEKSEHSSHMKIFLDEQMKNKLTEDCEIINRLLSRDLNQTDRDDLILVKNDIEELLKKIEERKKA